MTAEKLLVIILSATLALSLILTIVILIKVLGVVKRFQKISDNLEQLSDKAVSVSDVIKSAITPLAIGKVIASITTMVTSSKKKRKKREE